MKLRRRMIEARLRDTENAIQEKYGEKKKALHVVIVDHDNWRYGETNSKDMD